MKRTKRFDEVYSIFTDWFGEDRVDFDLSGVDRIYFIIWFPEVQLESVREMGGTGTKMMLNDLFLRIPCTIRDDKVLYDYVDHKVEIKRATFTQKEFDIVWRHSHAQTQTRVDSWVKFCIGHGPIEDTIWKLQAKDEDDLWQILCQQIEQMVGVESIDGVPYRSIESMMSEGGTKSTYYLNKPLTQIELSKTSIAFAAWILKRENLPLVWHSTGYDIDCDPVVLAEKMASWYKEFRNKNNDTRYYTIDDSVYVGYPELNYVIKYESPYRVSREGSYVITFKGKSFYVRITDKDSVKLERKEFLKLDLYNSTVYWILNYLNKPI